MSDQQQNIKPTVPRRIVAFNETVYNGQQYPASCYTMDGRADWPKAFQWVCPELTNDEATLCVRYGRSVCMPTTVAAIKLTALRVANIEPIAEPDDNPLIAVVRSSARIRAMELGFDVWPSASGWAPYDLPWKERRILIGIVEGIASLSRWAHEIWLRDHPSEDSDDCCICGDPSCPE